MTEDTKKIGRPENYTPETAKQICQLIESGMTLTAICQLPDMPHISTIYDWQDSHPEFTENYSRAKGRQADTMASMVLDEAFGSHDAQIGRLRMDALKWFASKMAPKKYGEKVEVEQTGTQNFKLSFSVPDRTTSGGLQELQAPAPQLLEIQPEPIIVPEGDAPGFPE